MQTTRTRRQAEIRKAMVSHCSTPQPPPHPVSEVDVLPKSTEKPVKWSYFFLISHAFSSLSLPESLFHRIPSPSQTHFEPCPLLKARHTSEGSLPFYTMRVSEIPMEE